MIYHQKENILIIDDFHPHFVETLTEAGFNCNYQPDIQPNEAINLMKDFQVVAVRSKLNFTRDIIDALPNLKCIARGGAGMDNIDEAYAISKGIDLINAPEGNRDAVAEHTIGLLLGMSKRIVWSHNEVAQGNWRREENRGWEIGGKTLGLIGFGHTGSTVAKKLRGFDVKILAYDKYLEDYGNEYVEACSIEKLLKESDIISFHVPLTEETNGMLNRDLVSKMKDQVVLINTSRGKVARLNDMIDGIKSGKIKALAMDVLEDENLKAYTTDKLEALKTLIAENQVIITPHIAGWSYESYFKIAQVLSEKLLLLTTKPKNI
ncbi:MAG: phosphoglycerate dehydrogenase [Bacteroidia bacterium]|nr:phosphoglycerate dehydrogenase [Bacteroidia bacterium]